MAGLPIAVVVPTIGRPSIGELARSLGESLARTPGLRLVALVFVDDRPAPDPPLTDLLTGLDRTDTSALTVIRSGGRGPAAARNAGAVAAAGRHPSWIVFIDDDMVTSADWAKDLERDLVDADPTTGAVQGRIRMTEIVGRRLTDWERRMAGMAGARWLTGDIAYRTDAFFAVGGFDERFRRNYREDSDLAIRVRDAGWSLSLGLRETLQQTVPEPSTWWSVAAQSGNRYDALMLRLHGRAWRTKADTPRGRRRLHLLIVAAAVASIATFPLSRRASGLCGIVFALAMGHLTMWRVGRSRRTPREVLVQVLTSLVIPFLAVGHWCVGLWAYRSAQPWQRISPLTGRHGEELS